MTDHLVLTTIKAGSWHGKEVFLPRMAITCNKDLPFTLTRRQFPLRLAFAMTMNKSQGQTMGKVAIYLPDPVFSHGQLYVALSIARSSDTVKLFIKNSIRQGYDPRDGKTRTVNVVFKSIFQN